MGFSAQGLANIRAKAARTIEDVFAVEISIGDAVIPAARSRATQGGTNELAGVLSDLSVGYRIRREAIPGGTVITPKTTIIVEGDRRYRVQKVHDTVGDPALYVECEEA